MARRRAEYLKGKSCVRCGSSDRLEVDHIDPSTKVSHRIWSWSAKRMNAELAKCQVLCHACHWEKTKADMGWNHHGTYGYKQGCHCAICRAAHAASNRRNRGRKVSTAQ